MERYSFGYASHGSADRILKRIRAKHRGFVFTPKEFAHLGTRAAMDQALSRLQRSGQIRRLTWSVYEFPKIHSNIGLLSPSPEAVAKAIAKRTRSRIAVSPAKAANLLGLSTQVPMQNVFWTEGPSRTIRIGNQIVVAKILGDTPIVVSETGTMSHMSGFARFLAKWMGRAFESHRIINLQRVASSGEITLVTSTV